MSYIHLTHFLHFLVICGPKVLEPQTPKEFTKVVIGKLEVNFQYIFSNLTNILMSIRLYPLTITISINRLTIFWCCLGFIL